MKIVDLFENKNITEIFDDFIIDPNKSLTEQLENLKEDMFQAKIDNKIIDIGWYPEFDIKGRFVILIIENQDWENPIFRAEAKDIQKLSSIIKKTIGQPSRTRKTNKKFNLEEKMKKRIYNLEKELDRDNSESFIYELNKNAVFNIQKFEYLVQSIEEYLENSAKTTENTRHLWIKNEIIIIFEHTLWSIACHYMPNDLFFIKNINEIEEKLPNYYQTIRIYSEKIMFNQ